ncbi:hypothetical protein SS50377_21381 [Spironucleus salmonicida]|uniref:Uncharacterized protein n=1 Tax=Spironucleus salmonicida TaxID=348837 RepID=V6LTX6_9EUKA|nr:hypothetical protein SS50377_21381 [Spironucleus salmonicida]|eukprot:EST44229.1 Hypothetical protein SS50377_15952 [Spironucleus salmonicida]
MSCLDCTKQTDENQHFHISRAVYNHKFTASKDFEVVGFKGYSVESRKISLLGIADVCCWTWNTRIWDILKQVRVLLGCWQDGSGFAFYVIVLAMHRMVQCILLSIRIQFTQGSWQHSLIPRNDIQRYSILYQISVNTRDTSCK